jgi:hypothetical protein
VTISVVYVLAPIIIDLLALQHNPLQGISIFHLPSLLLSCLRLYGDLFCFGDRPATIKRRYSSIAIYRAKKLPNHLSGSDEPLQTRNKENTLQIGITRNNLIGPLAPRYPVRSLFILLLEHHSRPRRRTHPWHQKLNLDHRQSQPLSIMPGH